MRELIFWGMWLIIPLLVEVFIAVFSFIYLVVRKRKPSGNILFKDKVSILIPVYNSEKTIAECIESVAIQSYGRENIEVLLLNNGERDKSYDIYLAKNLKYKDLNMWWYDTKQGKAKALNAGIFSATGQYIINIDSDGVLERNAVENIIKKFNTDDDIKALTGVILTDYGLIEETKSKMLKIMQKTELFEYAESFLLGRNFTSISGDIYTMAGAFSAFKREVLVNTFLYNHETVGEDTHMTFQIKYTENGKVQLCEDALFFVDPIASVNQLYTQRQRWQIGQLEVGKLYYQEHTGNVLNMMFKRPIRVLLSAHTLAFPRLVWFFGTIYLYIKGYPFWLLFFSAVGMYFLYVLSSSIGYVAYMRYLKGFDGVRNYIKKNKLTILFLPLYRTLIYLFRIAGVINSRNTDVKWTAFTLTDELGMLKRELKATVNIVIKPLRIILSRLMEEDKDE